MSSLVVRRATEYDRKSLLDMPPYSNSKIVSPFAEDIFVAEKDGKVIGAISVGYKDVTYVSREWHARALAFVYARHANTQTKILSGCWISKLYVSTEHRHQGVGTELVMKSLKHLKENGFTEGYTGINIENGFRSISQHIFQKNGFKKHGSCLCLSPKGRCRGILLKKTIDQPR